MPSMSGWALRHVDDLTVAYAVDHHVSMPSMSGWALRLPVLGFGLIGYVSMPSMSGWALRHSPGVNTLMLQVSMPSMSGWALRRRVDAAAALVVYLLHRFYALDVGLGFATDVLGGHR